MGKKRNKYYEASQSIYTKSATEEASMLLRIDDVIATWDTRLVSIRVRPEHDVEQSSSW